MYAFYGKLFFQSAIFISEASIYINIVAAVFFREFLDGGIRYGEIMVISVNE